jgi:hypothetical protein
VRSSIALREDLNRPLDVWKPNPPWTLGDCSDAARSRVDLGSPTASLPTAAPILAPAASERSICSPSDIRESSSGRSPRSTKNGGFSSVAPPRDAFSLSCTSIGARLLASSAHDARLGASASPTNKPKHAGKQRMRAEYDFSNGVRGKYVGRVKRTARLAKLDHDVARVFRDDKSVNDALRALAEILRKHGSRKRK